MTIYHLAKAFFLLRYFPIKQEAIDMFLFWLSQSYRLPLTAKTIAYRTVVYNIRPVQLIRRACRVLLLLLREVHISRQHV